MTFKKVCEYKQKKKKNLPLSIWDSFLDFEFRTPTIVFLTGAALLTTLIFKIINNGLKIFKTIINISFFISYDTRILGIFKECEQINLLN